MAKVMTSLQFALVQLLGFRFEGFVFFLLFGENLNQLHAGKVFGQEGVKLGNFVSGQLISLAGQRTEKKVKTVTTGSRRKDTRAMAALMESMTTA